MTLIRGLIALVLMSGISGAETLEIWACESYNNPVPYKQQWIISTKGIQVIGGSAFWQIAQNNDKVAVGWFTSETSNSIYVILDKKTGTLIELEDDKIFKGTEVIPITTFVNHCTRQ
jgi:hypothetical protein